MLSSGLIAAVLSSVVGQVATTPAPSSYDCAPPCRSGYVCIRGACVSPCNPPCSALEQCTSQGECIPRSVQQPSPSLAPSSMTREQVYREIQLQEELKPGNGPPLALLGIGIPHLLVGVIGFVVDVLFIVSDNMSEGKAIGLAVSSWFALTGGTMTVLGILQLKSRSAERAAIQSRIDELQRMLGAPSFRSSLPRGPRVSIEMARF